MLLIRQVNYQQSRENWRTRRTRGHDRTDLVELLIFHVPTRWKRVETKSHSKSASFEPTCSDLHDSLALMIHGGRSRNFFRKQKQSQVEHEPFHRLELKCDVGHGNSWFCSDILMPFLVVLSCLLLCVCFRVIIKWLSIRKDHDRFWGIFFCLVCLVSSCRSSTFVIFSMSHQRVTSWYIKSPSRVKQIVLESFTVVLTTWVITSGLTRKPSQLYPRFRRILSSETTLWYLNTPSQFSRPAITRRCTSSSTVVPSRF